MLLAPPHCVTANRRFPPSACFIFPVCTVGLTSWGSTEGSMRHYLLCTKGAGALYRFDTPSNQLLLRLNLTDILQYTTAPKHCSPSCVCPMSTTWRMRGAAKGPTFSPRYSSHLLQAHSILESHSIWEPVLGIFSPTNWVSCHPRQKSECYLLVKVEENRNVRGYLDSQPVKPLHSDELRHVEINPSHLGERLGIWCPNESLIYYGRFD